jgi:hypothetical protein
MGKPAHYTRKTNARQTDAVRYVQSTGLTELLTLAIRHVDGKIRYGFPDKGSSNERETEVHQDAPESGNCVCRAGGSLDGNLVPIAALAVHVGRDKMTFEAYSYRTSSRFGSRVCVTVKDGLVSVTGPRVGLLAYRLWIVIQALILVSIPVAFGLAIVYGDWWFLVLAVILFGLHFAAGGIGAGCLWELQNVTAFFAGTAGETITFPVAEVEDVRLGKGWARRGMWLLLLPYFKGIDSLAQGVPGGIGLSFIAPDGTPDGGVYAIHLRTVEEAQTLAELLS